MEAPTGSEAFLRCLADAAHEGIAIHERGVILEANRAMSELFGYEHDELIGRNVLELAAPESWDIVTDQVTRGLEEPYEAIGLRKDGSTFVGEVAGKAVSSPGRTLRVTTVRDVTLERQAERQLRDAEARYRTLVEQLPASVFISDARDGSRVLYMSPNHERITGYSIDEYVRDPYFWRTTVHPDDRDWVTSEAGRTDTSGDPFSAEYRIVTKDGRVVWVREHAVLVRDATGEPICWQGLMLDVTEQKLAEEQRLEAEARYRSLLEQIPAVVFVCPPYDTSRPIWVSPYAESLLEYTAAEMTESTDVWDMVIHPEDRDWVLAEAERTDQTGEPFVADYRMLAKSGSTVWVREHTLLVRGDDGEPKFWQGALFDITEIKRAEEGLERALSIEREASQRLQALDEMKNTFLEAVSHDLRTPLTAILGTSLTLDQHGSTISKEESEHLIHRLAANSRKLDKLLSDLLDLDRLSRGILELKRRSVDVTALARQVVGGTEALADRTVEVEGNEVIGEIDPAKVERIIENLLTNAARHTKPGTRIWVRAWREPNAVLLAVEDDGSGVPAHLASDVFKPFQRGELSSPSPGIGIGLSLVARFAEMHGGHAWVAERDGGGASFQVLLPDASISDEG